MSAKPWAEPGLSVEERAALVAGHDAGLLSRRVVEALRAAEADGHARGAYARDLGAAVADEAERIIAREADAPGHSWMSYSPDGDPAVCLFCDAIRAPGRDDEPCPRRPRRHAPGP